MVKSIVKNIKWGASSRRPLSLSSPLWAVKTGSICENFSNVELELECLSMSIFSLRLYARTCLALPGGRY